MTGHQGSQEIAARRRPGYLDWPGVFITNITICENTPQLSLQSLGFRLYLALQGAWMPALPIIKLQTPANLPLNFQISIGLSSKPRGPHLGSFLEWSGLSQKQDNEGSGGLQKTGGHLVPLGRQARSRFSDPMHHPDKTLANGLWTPEFPESQQKEAPPSLQSPRYPCHRKEQEAENNLGMGSDSWTNPSV